MSNLKDIDSVLNKAGMSQNLRFIEELNPVNLELNDFEVEDWILFSYNFAKHLNFFDTKNGGSTRWKLARDV